MASTEPAHGVRMSWHEVPDRIVVALEQWAGSSVVEVIDQTGGFSPGPASLLTLRDGRRIFVKAGGPELNPDTPGIHRREAMISRLSPAKAPTPRLLWHYDEGERGWIMLVFEAIDGRPPSHPWQTSELERVIAALRTMARELTPSPIDAAHAGYVADAFRHEIKGWRRLAEKGGVIRDEWSRSRLSALLELEDQAPDAVAGGSLVHLDVRADNLLIADGGDVVLVDWPHARVGAAWVDIVLMAPSIVLEGGPLPEDVLQMYGHRGRRIAPHRCRGRFIRRLPARACQPPATAGPAHTSRVSGGPGRRGFVVAKAALSLK